jgi:Copper amine oxidase N-terminal domain.
MKKFILFFITFAVFLNCYAYADDSINVVLSGKKLEFDVAPTVINGRTVLPVRTIFEELGLGVEWDGNTRTITGTKDGLVITLQIDNKEAKVNDKTVILDVPATIIDGRTVVPGRFVAEATGADVEWEGSTRTFYIDTKIESEHDIFDGYTLIEVDGGNLSGHREPNAVVDIGYGNREYYAFTNKFGQLVRVIADEIILQDKSIEPVLSTGRYYSDEAKVPGVESANLDEGHVIADSLGGVSNAYNITPQNSILNRQGDQAYMEKWIRDAGGCTNFEAIITYPNTQTQIPSKYKYTYTLKGNVIVDEFENINPDESISTKSSQEEIITLTPKVISPVVTEVDLSKIDTNGNGVVTISEAKNAGYSMPITSSHWLYKYMIDSDGDGRVGE